MKIILISGKAEAGKTTTAKYLKKKLGEQGKTSAIVPYGQYVKDTAKMLFNWMVTKTRKVVLCFNGGVRTLFVKNIRISGSIL